MFGSARRSELRRKGLAAAEGELARLRALGPHEVASLARRSPVESERDGIALTTRIHPEGDLLLVLVEASRGRRMLGTAGFAMAPDGTTRTPH